MRKRGPIAAAENGNLKQNFIHPGIFRTTLLPNRNTLQEGRITFGSAAFGHWCGQLAINRTREIALSHSQDKAAPLFFFFFFFLTIELIPLLREQHCFDRPCAPARIN